MRTNIFDTTDIPPDAEISVLGRKSFSMECAKLIQAQAPDLRLTPRANERELLAAVQAGGYGLFPFQNFSSTEVDSYLELLRDQPNISVVGDAMLEVKLAAIGNAGATREGIRRVLSHPQALRQSNKFVRSLPNVEKKILTDSTDEAILSVKNADDAIALASADAIPAGSGLQVFQHRISNNEMDGKQNATHFLAVHGNGNRKSLHADRDRQLWMVTPPDKPGALASITDTIYKYGGNLYVVLTRPTGVEEHQFLMGIEATGSETDYERMHAKINELADPDDPAAVIETLGGVEYSRARSAFASSKNPSYFLIFMLSPFFLRLLYNSYRAGKEQWHSWRPVLLPLSPAF